MDASEAKLKSLWYSISIHVRKYIEDAVKQGLSSVQQFKSVDFMMYYHAQQDAWKLRKLHYNVDFETINFKDSPDNKVTITW